MDFQCRIAGWCACVAFASLVFGLGAVQAVTESLPVGNLDDEDVVLGNPVFDASGTLVPANSGSILVGTFSGMDDAAIVDLFAGGNVQALRDAFTLADDAFVPFGFAGNPGLFRANVPVPASRFPLLDAAPVYIWIIDGTDFLSPASQHLIFKADTTFDHHIIGNVGLVLSNTTGQAVIGEFGVFSADGAPGFNLVAIPEASHLALFVGLAVFWIGVRNRRRKF